MKLHCPYSGIIFTVSHFSGVIPREHIILHPIFELPTSILLSRSNDFFAGRLNPIERRLLYLATLNSTKLVEFRTTANPTDQIITATFEILAHTVGWMDMYSWDSKVGRRTGPAFPKFIISGDTKSLSNIRYWLDIWQDCRIAYESGGRRESIQDRIHRRERALHKLIHNSSKSPEDYSYMLAQWAADAADFPTNIRVKTIDAPEVQITLREYWIALMREKNPYAVPRNDMAELLEHLEQNLEHGTIFAYNTMKLVREKMSRAADSLGLADDASLSQEDIERIYNTPFRIIPEGDAIEDHNIKSGAENAPVMEPVRQQYASKVLYLQARAKWLLSQHGALLYKSLQNKGNKL